MKKVLNKKSSVIININHVIVPIKKKIKFTEKPTKKNLNQLIFLNRKVMKNLQIKIMKRLYFFINSVMFI